MTVVSIVLGTLILLQLHIFICGCSSPADTDSSKEPPGRWLYSAKCASCHSLISPQEHTRETWVHYVHKYGKQMTDSEKQQVIEYLASKAAVDIKIENKTND